VQQRNYNVAGIVLFLLLPFLLNAQAKFYTVVDQPTIGKNQPLQVQYVVENAKSVDKFSTPSFANFVLLQGPIESSGMSVINGSVSQYKALVYVIQPRTTGKLTIPGASAVVDGKKLSSNSVVVTVTNKAVPVPANSNLGLPVPDEVPSMERELFIRPNENVIEKIRKNLFVKAEVNKTSVYVNEPVVATYKLYSRVRSESRVVKRPSYNGFSVYDMVEPDGTVSGVETINGKSYNVHVIRQSQLFPLQAGTFTLDPVEVENIVRFIKTDSEQPNSGFDDLFNPNAETVEQTLTLNSKPVTIQVKPLPLENQPTSFDGAVGNFKVEAFVEGDSIKSGEEATLIVKVKGKGNLPIINAPGIKWPEGVEAYDPETKEMIHPETVPLSGEKNFRFRFTSKKTGTVVIPSIQFTFFDPTSKSYKTDSTADLRFDMIASTSRTAPIPKEQVSKSGTPGTNNTLLIWIASGAVLIVICLWVVASRQSAKRNEAKKKALEEARKKQVAEQEDPLAIARVFLSKGDNIGFLKEVQNAIWKESAEKLSIRSTSLNKSRVISELNARGAASTGELFNQLVNDIETSLYIPGQSSENLQEISSNASKYVSLLSVLVADASH